jgi:hypothetical protein
MTPVSSTISRSVNIADMYNNAPCIIETQVCALIVIFYFRFFAVADHKNSALHIAVQIITATGTRFLVYADLRCLTCHQVHPTVALHMPPLLQPTIPATTFMMNICSGFFLIRQGYQRQVRSPSHLRHLTSGMYWLTCNRARADQSKQAAAQAQAAAAGFITPFRMRIRHSPILQRLLLPLAQELPLPQLKLQIAVLLQRPLRSQPQLLPRQALPHPPFLRPTPLLVAAVPLPPLPQLLVLPLLPPQRPRQQASQLKNQLSHPAPPQPPLLPKPLKAEAKFRSTTHRNRLPPTWHSFRLRPHPRPHPLHRALHRPNLRLLQVRVSMPQPFVFVFTPT